METYWTPHVLGNFLNAFLGLGLFLFFWNTKKYSEKRYQVPIAIFGYFLFMTLVSLTNGCLNFFHYYPLGYLHKFFISMSVCCAYAFFEQINFGQIRWKYILPLAIITWGPFFAIFASDGMQEIEYAGFKLIRISGFAAIIYAISVLCLGIYMIIIGIHYSLKAPWQLRRYMIILLTSTTAMMLLQVTFESFMFMRQDHALDSLFYIFELIWVIGSCLIFLYQYWLVFMHPEFSWILVLRLRRLICISNESGITLFEYQWYKTSVNDMLLSGIIQALQKISAEAIELGRIRELRVENGALLLCQGKSVSVGVITELPSDLLSQRLYKFLLAFESKFATQILSQTGDVSDFHSADSLIKDVFFGVTSFEK